MNIEALSIADVYAYLQDIDDSLLPSDLIAIAFIAQVSTLSSYDEPLFSDELYTKGNNLYTKSTLNNGMSNRLAIQEREMVDTAYEMWKEETDDVIDSRTIISSNMAWFACSEVAKTNHCEIRIPHSLMKTYRFVL